MTKGANPIELAPLIFSMEIKKLNSEEKFDKVGRPFGLVILDSDISIVIGNDRINDGQAKPCSGLFGHVLRLLLSVDEGGGEELVITLAQAVPEPGTLVLLGISMVSIVGLRRMWKE